MSRVKLLDTAFYVDKRLMLLFTGYDLGKESNKRSPPPPLPATNEPKMIVIKKDPDRQQKHKQTK